MTKDRKFKGTRDWVFTINNPIDTDVKALLNMKYTCLLFAFELGTKNQGEHIQGYVYFPEARTRSAVSKDIPRGRLEKSKGTFAHNLAYLEDPDPERCKKVDKDLIFLFGVPPKQGQAKWEHIQAVMADPTLNFHLYNQYRKSYKEYMSQQPVEQRPRKISLLPKRDRYKFALACRREHKLSVCLDPSQYDNEHVHIISSTFYDDEIINWCEGLPPKVKYGFEYRYYDPLKIVMLYEGYAERDKLQEIYRQYIDEEENQAV
jgi:hypothetical protein